MIDKTYQTKPRQTRAIADIVKKTHSTSRLKKTVIFPVLWAEKGSLKNTSHTVGRSRGIFTGSFRRSEYRGYEYAQFLTVYENFSGEKRVGTSRA
ncbi:TPA: hypothetical protein RXU17_001022 [Escherichia coli]|nr:hypothetical protein [Escherichia coli]